MEKDAHILWEECRAIIRDNITPEQYKTSFAFVEIKSFAKGELVLNVPSPFIQEIIESQYLGLLSAVFKRVFKTPVRLYYNILKDKEHNIRTQEGASPSPKTTASTPADQKRPANVAPDPFMAPAVQDLNSQLRPAYNFDNYLEGESNRLARAVGEAIAKDPAKTFNPFFVYGPSGCGKTHLINAIGLRIKELHPQMRVLYVSAHLFTVQWTDAVRKNMRNDFIAFYQTIDVLIIDDIQELAGKTDTQNTFFHIFNHLHLNSKQIILSADRPPVAIEGLTDRLLSRFKWGMIAEVERPTRSLRFAILSAKVRKEGLRIPDNVLNYISENIDDNVRDLEGIITSLMAHSVVQNCEINLNLVRQLMPRYNKVAVQDNNECTFDTIKTAVCEHFGIKVSDLLSRSRRQPLAYIRQLTLYLGSKHTETSEVQLGIQCGDRQHSTVIHAIKNIKNLIDIDEKTKQDILAIETLL